MKSPARERRKFGRRDVCKPASIILADSTVLRCTIVNLSEGGAMLSPHAAGPAADRFDLIIPEDDAVIACRVVHRSEARIGVAYISLPRRASRVLFDAQRRARAELMRTLLAPAPNESDADVELKLE